MSKHPHHPARPQAIAPQARPQAGLAPQVGAPQAPQVGAPQAPLGAPQAGAPLGAAPLGAQDALEGAKRAPQANPDGSLPHVQPPQATEETGDEPELPPLEEVAAAAAKPLRAFRATTERLMAWQGRTFVVKVGDVLTEEKHGSLFMDQLERVSTFELVRRE